MSNTPAKPIKRRAVITIEDTGDGRIKKRTKFFPALKPNEKTNSPAIMIALGFDEFMAQMMQQAALEALQKEKSEKRIIVSGDPRFSKKA